MDTRAELWTEEAARVWWAWGSDSDQPFPGVARTAETFLCMHPWIEATAEKLSSLIRTRVKYRATCPLPAYLRNVVPLAPAVVDPPENRTMCGAASILAPPARRRGQGQRAAMTT